jgi:hypothetical protein
MEELELLKKDWNTTSDNFKDYSEKEIYTMIKRKSVSVIKTLFVIGLIEIILWTVYGYVNGELPYIRLGLFMVFFILIIYLFNTIRVGKSSISLMKGILNVRKVIFGYAVISFLLIILDNIINFSHYTRDFMAGLQDGMNENAYHTSNPADITPELSSYIIFGAILILTVYLIYLIYKKTYGKILFNLKKNYKELIKVES